MRNPLTAGLAFVILGSYAICSFAATFPEARPITIVIPFPVGSKTDAVGRELAVHMSKHLHQAVLVENMVGEVAVQKIVVAPKDGYYLLLHSTPLSTLKWSQKNIDINPMINLEYVGQVVDIPMVMLGSKWFGSRDFRDVVKQIQGRSSSVSIGHAGVGSVSYLCSLLLMSETQRKLQLIAYRGSNQAIAGLMRGQVDLVCDFQSAADLVNSEKLGTYVLANGVRRGSASKISAEKELVFQGLDVVAWHGVYLPRGVSPAVKQILVSALRGAVSDPVFNLKMIKIGGHVVSIADASPQSLEAKLAEETARWSRVMEWVYPSKN